MIANMSIIRNRLATLTQRIKSSRTSKTDLKNKFYNDRNLNFKFHSKSTRQHNDRDDSTSN